MKRSSIMAVTSVAALGLGLGATSAAVSAAAEDQSNADDAIAAFTEQVTGAGFESYGEGDAVSALDLAPDPDEDPDDPTVAATNACLADLVQYVEADGTFVGETARAASDGFELSSDEPPSTDPMAIAPYDDISAAVVYVEDPEGITAIVDAFAGGELFECALAAMSSTESSEPPPEFSFDEEPLDLGDQAVVVHLSTVFTVGEQDFTYNINLGLARVDRALAVVSFSSTGEPLSDIDATAALETLVDSLS